MICLFLGAVLCGGTAAAQHTLGVTGGYGYGNARFYPKEEPGWSGDATRRA